MKRFLVTMVFAVIFMANSAQAANGKIYFADSAGLSITDDLGSPGLNISFSPGYNAPRKDSALEQFDAHGVEVVSADRIDAEERPPVVIARDVAGQKGVFNHPLVQRDVVHDADRFDTGNRREPIHEVQMELGEPPRV